MTNEDPIMPVEVNADLLPMVDEDIDHDCVTVIDSSTSPRPDFMQTLIPNSDMILYTDGSACRASDNKYLAGYAVVNDWEVLEANSMPYGTSAQAAEVYALTRACILAKDKVATIYTDSRYAFGVAHDFGQLWKMRGFLTSSGKPIQHHTLVANLLEAIMLPTLLVIVKCAAHSAGSDSVKRGNALAIPEMIINPTPLQSCLESHRSFPSSSHTNNIVIRFHGPRPILSEKATPFPVSMPQPPPATPVCTPIQFSSPASPQTPSEEPMQLDRAHLTLEEKYMRRGAELRDNHLMEAEDDYFQNRKRGKL
ncbi:hypothetical protein F2P81_025333 [Scophthalmus maximus]|uniref:RNase H type-1 domain-containing protein n=1 Tax=Scophthalmus maximus TaxID=52904 RepID=A0A6A4RT93_SCOMX|nr:hypothetical protein F2P81_025333 [Scophthalmus maximus]